MSFSHAALELPCSAALELSRSAAIGLPCPDAFDHPSSIVIGILSFAALELPSSAMIGLHCPVAIATPLLSCRVQTMSSRTLLSSSSPALLSTRYHLLSEQV